MRYFTEYPDAQFHFNSHFTDVAPAKDWLDEQDYESEFECIQSNRQELGRELSVAI